MTDSYANDKLPSNPEHARHAENHIARAELDKAPSLGPGKRQQHVNRPNSFTADTKWNPAFPLLGTRLFHVGLDQPPIDRHCCPMA